MGRKYGEIAFTDTVMGVQTALGSRRGYAAMARKASDFLKATTPEYEV